MRYESAETEYGAIALGVFSLAGIPVICSKHSYWSSNNTIYCTLVGCVADRKQVSHTLSSCCAFRFEKDRTLNIKWDHVSQLRREGTPSKVNADIVYTIGPYYSGWNLLSTSVNLVKPDSLTKAAQIVREASLFHLRAGHERRNYMSNYRTLNARPS